MSKKIQSSVTKMQKDSIFSDKSGKRSNFYLVNWKELSQKHYMGFFSIEFKWKMGIFEITKNFIYIKMTN